MAFCPYCGSEIPSDANFCPFCGNKLNIEALSPVREHLNSSGSVSGPELLNTVESSPVQEQLNFADFIKELEDRFPNRIIDLSQWDHARWDAFSGRYCVKYQCTLKDLLSDFKFTVKDSGQAGNSGKKNRKKLTEKEQSGEAEESGYFADFGESTVPAAAEAENMAEESDPAETKADVPRKKSGIGGSIVFLILFLLFASAGLLLAFKPEIIQDSDINGAMNKIYSLFPIKGDGASGSSGADASVSGVARSLLGTTNFPRPKVGESFRNDDGHSFWITGSDNSEYSVEISIARALSLDCKAKISDDRMYFSGMKPNEAFDGYIQYTGKDYTLVFINGGYPLTSEKTFSGFSRRAAVFVDPYSFIGDWASEDGRLKLTINDYDGYSMKGSITTDKGIGKIPFSTKYDLNSGLNASFSYKEYTVDLLMVPVDSDDHMTLLGVECSVIDRNYDVIFGTSGRVLLSREEEPEPAPVPGTESSPEAELSPGTKPESSPEPETEPQTI
ncbi:MAG: zinc-ribbon domain-containing protein [Eubacteriales bacterium]|nr:zinc-ribbon domain-containing protein [Eubacteriales bacterium]